MVFFKSLETGDLDKIRSMVSDRPELLDCYNYRSFGATPLTMACLSNRLALVKLLLELGADPNRKSEWEMGPWSPLHCAVFRRDKALAELLLSYGATMDVHTAAGLGRCEAVAKLLDSDPSRVNEKGGDGCHPLHFAETIDVAKLLLDRGAEIDGRCLDHFSTPLQYLCSSRPKVARFLIASGATPDIFSAVICGDANCIESLLVANPQLIDARINQAFFPPGNGHDVHNILTFTVGQDSTPLHAAAKGNQGKAVSILIRYGHKTNVRGGYDQATPLHTAAWSNCSIAAEALLDRGADIEARSGPLHNNTPAGWAIVAGSAETFGLLLDRGATCHEWFFDDARDACAGRFDQVSSVASEQRFKILERINRISST